MKIKLLSLMLLFFVAAGCVRTTNELTQPTNVSAEDYAAAEYQKLYYDYRALVTTAIKNNDQANLNRITDEYANKVGKDIFLVTISRLDSSGKWSVLLHKTDPNTHISLPKIHYAYSERVHIHKGKDFVLCESNKTENRTYADNIHIRMAIKR